MKRKKFGNVPLALAPRSSLLLEAAFGHRATCSVSKSFETSFRALATVVQ
jgi:hypothetical protein